MNAREKRLQRQTRVRKKVQGTSGKPRLTVFRSNKYLYAQLVDDTSGKTLLGVSEGPAKPRTGRYRAKQDKKAKGSGLERAKQVGIALAKQAVDKKITKVVFDKGRYAYHGRVKAIADGAREGGLQF